jgi:hypothetical protein
MLFTKTRFTAVTFTLLAASLSAFTCAQAQEAAAPAAPPTFVKPVGVMQEGQFAAGVGNEAVFTVRYTVKADGTTANFENLGGFTNPFYDKAVNDFVAKWTFKPGTVNGEAKDFLNQEYSFTRRISEQLGVSDGAKKALENIRLLIDAKDAAAARKAIKTALEQDAHSVFDYALLNQMLATVELGLNDPFAALEAIKHATSSTVNMAGTREYLLTPEILKGAFTQHLMLAATVRQHGEVLRAWAEMDALYDVPADDGVQQWVAAAKQALASPDQLVQLGKIVADKQASHVPSRRIFSVADVREGKLEQIVAHCDRRTLELEYKEGVDWNLPASFGECELEFQGDNGTLFTVYEFVQ